MPERIPQIVDDFMARRRRHCLPPHARQTAERIADGTLALLFPHFCEGLPCEAEDVERELRDLGDAMRRLREGFAQTYAVPPEGVVDDFLARLPALHEAIVVDARAILDGDPAAKSLDEVIIAYPGLYAVAIHRIAHWLNEASLPLLPRLLSEYAHKRTGVDIHPGATIGPGLMIDHGTGLVIGETAVLGRGVRLYQGVTIGALVIEKSLAATKRHPTLEDHVVVYANATILGGETTIGHDSIVGGNAWVTRSVPPYSFVTRDAEIRPRKPGTESELEYYI